MRYPASEKLEIIRLVEESHLPVRRTLEKLGIQPSRFYRWYDRLQTGGPEALEDKAPRPKHVWNRIPAAMRGESGATRTPFPAQGGQQSGDCGQQVMAA